MALYSIRRERALCELIAMNAGFRWFVGLDWDDRVLDHSTLSRNRERLYGSGAADHTLIRCLAAKQRLLNALLVAAIGANLQKPQLGSRRQADIHMGAGQAALRPVRCSEDHT